MKRVFDILVSFISIIFLIIPVIIIIILIRLSSKGNALHWSKRVGRDGVIFMMPKFRSMRLDTPDIASHLMTDPEQYFTPIGKFLRQSSIDELPQLISIIKGDMSFVGPRPALFNQHDLIKLRMEKGIDKLLPGVTGWAQVNGRDEITIQHKVSLDEEYIKYKSFWFDMKILWLTFIKVVKTDGVSH
jgi:O-antigen biosynthesis protein WbqP